MKFGILTQPLQGNYGGIIQNWALQQVLIKLGYEPITIDVFPRNLSLGNYVRYNLASIRATVLRRGEFHYSRLYKHRTGFFDEFVDKNIITTRKSHFFSKSILRKNKIDAIIVGSDQVWRPKYNEGCLDDMFLQFAMGYPCPKISYAASFGSDNWEYSAKQTEACKKLINHFDMVSVREQSGMLFCEKYFGVQATQVLDPTLLLAKEDYLKLIEHTPKFCDKPFLAAYVLDMENSLRDRILQKAKEMNLEPIILSADGKASLTMEQWISIFRDAEYIFTDSFHGSVFSFIFEKKFEYVKNEDRGASRFKVIENLLASDNIKDEQEKSINFLKNIYELSKSQYNLSSL